VLDSRKMAKHFIVDIQDGHFAFQRRTEQIKAEARLDGIYVIRASVPAEHLAAGETVHAYKDLARVERALRCLKTVDLDIPCVRRSPASTGSPSTLNQPNCRRRPLNCSASIPSVSIS